MIWLSRNSTLRTAGRSAVWRLDFDQLIMSAGRLVERRSVETFGFVAIEQSRENYGGIRIGHVWIGQNFLDLLTPSFSAFVYV